MHKAAEGAKQGNTTDRPQLGGLNATEGVIGGRDSPASETISGVAPRDFIHLGVKQAADAQPTCRRHVHRYPR